MAEPGAAIKVSGAVASPRNEGLGEVGKSDPEALLTQIERTREDLAKTIDMLAERVSPMNNARRIRDKIGEQAARPQVRIGATAAGAVLVSLVILRAWARHRRAG
jgi:hypothetical protein